MITLNNSIQSQIKATVESDKEFAVSFDDAWQWLEYSRKDAAKRVLVANFEENIDYQLHNTAELRPQGGYSNREDIYLTKDCFKQLAMLSGTAKGKEVRLYFIQCEKELKAIKANQPQLPQDYLSALKALVVSEEEKQQLALKAAEAEAKVVEMTPKAEIYDVIANDEKLLSLNDAAKVIGVLGRNKLMELLRYKKVLQLSNIPYQKYCDQGYFKVVEKVTNVGVQPTTKVTQRGVEFLIRFLEKEGYTVPSKMNAA